MSSQFTSDCDTESANASEMSSMQLQNFPNELFDEIFKFLSLEDLANMSATCKKYKSLTENYFNRKHKDEVIGIVANKTVKFATRGKRYKIRFRYCIQSIEVDFETVDSITETFLFIKQNCASDLRSMLLYSYENEDEVTDSHFEIIKEQIQHLEILSAKDVCVGFLMKHCKDIRTLAIAKWYGVNGIDLDRNDWLTKCNPKLVTLIMDDIIYDEMALTHFLRMNPQLKAFVIKNAESTIGSLCASENKFEYVAVELTDEGSALLNLTKLKESYNRKSIKSFDLLLNNNENVDKSFGSVTLRAAFGLKIANGFHFVVAENNFSIFETMIEMPHIERLCVRFEIDLTANVFEKIVNAFPNLNSLWVYCSYDTSSDLFLEKFIIPIVSHCRRLELLYFPSFEQTRISKNDAIRMNNLRTKSKNASKLKINTDYCIPSKHSSVEVNRCHRLDAFCPLCNEPTINFKSISCFQYYKRCSNGINLFY